MYLYTYNTTHVMKCLHAYAVAAVYLCCCSPCHPVLCPLYLEPSLTLHNVLSVCEGVTEWRDLGYGLRVPPSKLNDIGRRHYQTASEGLEAVVKEWLAHHPAPSWKGLARALYKEGQLRALQRLYGKYLTGMWTCMLSMCQSETEIRKCKIYGTICTPMTNLSSALVMPWPVCTLTPSVLRLGRFCRLC